MPVQYLSIFKSKPGSAAELRLDLEQMIELALKELSCLQVSFYQDAGDQNYFIFHEVWFDEFGFEGHSDQIYVQNFLLKARSKLAEEIEIHKLNVIDSRLRIPRPESVLFKKHQI